MLNVQNHSEARNIESLDEDANYGDDNDDESRDEITENETKRKDCHGLQNDPYKKTQKKSR